MRDALLPQSLLLSLGLAAAGIALELALAPSWAGWLEGLELLDAAPR